MRNLLIGGTAIITLATLPAMASENLLPPRAKEAFNTKTQRLATPSIINLAGANYAGTLTRWQEALPTRGAGSSAADPDLVKRDNALVYTGRNPFGASLGREFQLAPLGKAKPSAK